MLKTKQSGMTLIEIMVSVLIVAILAAGLFSVSGYIDTQMKIKSTESTIHLLVAAVEQYHDFYKAFPDVNSTSYVGEYPNGKYDKDANGVKDANYIEKLYYKLTLAPDAKKILDQINRKYVKDSDKDSGGKPAPDKNPEIVDAWGRSLRYIYEKKINANFPEIISAGPDKDFGDGDAKKAEDNISSKKL
ncbi:MAG: type II secretion system GspH family protein [Planctomycetaceae bacterium]|nr:type II secretion system GspH family protein [Planctomycetaceae bacterium]